MRMSPEFIASKSGFKSDLRREDVSVSTSVGKRDGSPKSRKPVVSHNILLGSRCVFSTVAKGNIPRIALLMGGRIPLCRVTVSRELSPSVYTRPENGHVH